MLDEINTSPVLKVHQQNQSKKPLQGISFGDNFIEIGTGRVVEL